MAATNNLWTHIHYHAVGGESTPFLFKGREYYLLNLSPVHEAMDKSIPEHAVIVDTESGKQIGGRIFENTDPACTLE